MRLYSIGERTQVVDLGGVDVLFYHGRPVAFKDYRAKTLFVITEEVTREVPFRKEFVSGWTGKIDFTGGQAPLEERMLEALQAIPVPA
ncbi:MAG TPA: hypothetical protein VE173_13750 [Longimicrobiales bacterium]|nr:hypothetical protein [Longimicrobiales bacterium]